MPRQDARTVRFSRHAVERYIERVRPQLEGDLETAEAELQLIARVHGVIQSDPPEWAGENCGRNCSEQATAWLVVDICSIAMPILNGKVMTVLARGHLGEEARAKRNAHRRKQNADKAARRRAKAARKRLLAEPGWVDSPR